MSDIFRDYSFGGWLREWRRENQITLRDMALKIKMSAGNISKMERNELPPPRSAKRVEQIARAYGKPQGADFLKSLAFQYHLGILKKEFSE